MPLFSPAALIPSALAVPGNEFLFQSLLYLGFTLHLILVNVTLGSACIILMHNIQDRESYLASLPAVCLPKFLAFTINLGLIPLIFLLLIFSRYLLPACILSGISWLSIPFLIMLAYYGFYLSTTPSLFAKKRRHALLLSVFLLILALCAFVNLITIMQSPQSWLAYPSKSQGTLVNISDPQFFPRILHIFLACLAMGGLVIAIAASQKIQKLKKLNESEEKLNRLQQELQKGLGWYAGATSLQLFAGIWLILSIPTFIQERFLGGRLFPSSLLTLGIVCALLSLLSAKRQHVKLTLLLCLTTIFSMSGVRSFLRQYFLEDFPATIYTQTITSTLLLFLLSFGIVSAVLLFLLKLSHNPSKHKRPLFTAIEASSNHLEPPG